MAESFKVADGFVAVFADVDRRVVSSSASDAADEAGRVLGDGITRESSRSIRRNRGSFVTAGSMVGAEMGGGLLKSVGGMGASLGASLSALGPYAIGAAAAVGVAMAPALMAGLAGSITAGAGLGVIGLGAFLLREEPAMVAAATSLKDKTVSVFKTAAQPMLEPFVKSLGLIQNMVERLAPSFNQAFLSMAPAIEPLTRGLVSLVEMPCQES